MKKIFFLLLLFFLFFSCSNNTKIDNSLERVLSRGYIIFGYQENMAPLIFEKDGKLQGLLKDFIEILESDLKIQIKFKVLSSDEFIIDSLKSEKIDFVIKPDFYQNHDESFIKSRPIFSQRIAELLISESKSEKELLCSITDNIHYINDSLAEKILFQSPGKFLSSQKMYKSIVANNASAQWLSQKYPDKYTYRVLDRSYDYCIFLRSGDEKLLKKINKSISSSIKDSRIKKSSVRWLGVQKFSSGLF